jgi:hypothetical protein
MSPRPDDPCPSELALDELRAATDPRSHPAHAHVAGCPSCQARTRRAAEEDARFLEAHAPAMLDPVLMALSTSAPPRPRPRARLIRPGVWGLAGALAAGVLALILFLPVAPDQGLRLEISLLAPGRPDAARLKGHATASAQPTAPDAAPRPVRHGDALRPGDRLSVRAVLPRAGYLALYSLEASGAVNVVAPARGDVALFAEAGAQTLPLAIELDARPGHEALALALAPDRFSPEAARACLARMIATPAGLGALDGPLACAALEGASLASLRYHKEAGAP